MEIQDNRNLLIGIITLCDECISMKNNKKISNQDILAKHMEIYDYFNSLSLFDRLKIKIALNCKNIDLINFNYDNKSNFGIIINRILISWININIDKDILYMDLPINIKNNIKLYIFGDKKQKEDIIKKFLDTNIECKSFKEIIIPNNIENLVLESNNEIIKNIKKINNDIIRWKTKYNNNSRFKSWNNFLISNQINNWIYIPLNTKKRCYSSNHRRNKREFRTVNSFNKDFALDRNSNIIRRFYFLENKDDYINELKFNTKIHTRYIMNWIRNNFPYNYLIKYNHIKKFYDNISNVDKNQNTFLDNYTDKDNIGFEILSHINKKYYNFQNNNYID